MQSRHFLGALALWLLLTGCNAEVTGNEGGLECPDGSRPAAGICPVPSADEAWKSAPKVNKAERRICPRLKSRYARAGFLLQQAELPKRKRCVPRRAKKRLSEPKLDWPLPSRSAHCRDVTSIDWNWENDWLCTRADGSQFYTSAEGAAAFEVGR